MTGDQAGTNSGEAATPSPRDTFEPLLTRELKTVFRTRTYLLLSIAFALVLVGLVVASEGHREGYGPTVIDLLVPLEFLVPVIAIAFGYRAILGDERRGELDVFTTYPLSPAVHALAVYAGRAVGIVAAIVVPLAIIGGLVAVFPEETIQVFATHEAGDSPIVFARFVVLALLYGLVVLSLALAVSAVASSTRSALALAAAVLLFVVVGADLGIIGTLGAGWLPEDAVVYATALSPNSAFRGLVLETAIGVQAGPRAAIPLLNILGQLFWLVVGLVITVGSLRRR